MGGRQFFLLLKNDVKECSHEQLMSVLKGKPLWISTSFPKQSN
jgi:hypothetical protein